ncbi:MAG: molybdopterin converting factor subunit 1 [Deltaproteobacteria bacterium]|nr:molybdopterin converting factor subunit 1 [Deltaproteobacteria bacterium]
MEIRLRFFASIREKLHRSEAVCAVPAGITVGALLEQLCRDYPPLAEVRRSLSIAVNREYVDHDHPLADHDEVALIPPVSGGCHV